MKMEIIILDNGKIMISTEKELIIIKMGALNMRGSLPMIKKKDMENIFITTEDIMKVIGRII